MANIKYLKKKSRVNQLISLFFEADECYQYCMYHNSSIGHNMNQICKLAANTNRCGHTDTKQPFSHQLTLAFLSSVNTGLSLIS